MSEEDPEELFVEKAEEYELEPRDVELTESDYNREVTGLITSPVERYDDPVRVTIVILDLESASLAERIEWMMRWYAGEPVQLTED